MDQTTGNNNLPGLNDFCGNRDMTDCQEPKNPTAEPKKGNLWKDGAARGVAGLQSNLNIKYEEDLDLDNEDSKSADTQGKYIHGNGGPADGPYGEPGMNNILNMNKKIDEDFVNQSSIKVTKGNGQPPGGLDTRFPRKNSHGLKNSSIPFKDSSKFSPVTKEEALMSSVDGNTMESQTKKSNKFDAGVSNFYSVLDKLSNPNSFGK
jgi:hypothetical protein